MSQYRQLFDDAIGAGEPSTVDIAGIIHRQRRRRGLRNGSLVAGGMAAVVAIGYGAATLPGTFGDDSGRSRPAVGSPGPPPPSPGRSSISRDPVIEVRMTTAIRSHFAELAPGVRWETQPDFGNADFKPLMFEWFDPNADFPGQDFTPAHYSAATETIASSGQGTFFIVVGAWEDQTRVTGGGVRYVNGPNGKTLCDPKVEPGTCTRGPNGETIETGVDPGPKAQHAVGVVKPDGTFVYLVSNTMIDKKATSATRPALTTVQLTAIALDPAFSIRR